RLCAQIAYNSEFYRQILAALVATTRTADAIHLAKLPPREGWPPKVSSREQGNNWEWGLPAERMQTLDTRSDGLTDRPVTARKAAAVNDSSQNGRYYFRPISGVSPGKR